MDCKHLRVALMTNNLIQIDVNFASAKRVMIYDVSVDGSEFVDTFYFGYGSKRNADAGKKGPGGGRGCAMDDMGDDDGHGNDPLVERVNALEGCSLLFTIGLSDLAAYRVHQLKVFPVTSEKVRYIDDVLLQVQELMKSSYPPLWLRR